MIGRAAVWGVLILSVTIPFFGLLEFFRTENPYWLFALIPLLIFYVGDN